MGPVPDRTPNRYQLPMTSMVGALLVVLLVVAVVVGLQVLNGGNDATPEPTVAYQPWVRAGHQDGRLQTLAPARLPSGWRATSATYDSGSDPHWHLGVLTAHRLYVGVDESLDPVDQQVQTYVDPNARKGGTVQVGGHEWRVWTDSGGDYALVRQLKAPKGKFPETLVVVGSAPPAQVREFAALLR